MANNIKIGVHIDHSGQQIKNVALELLTTVQRNALTGTDLYDGRVIRNISTGHINIYNANLGQWEEIVNASDLNKFGALIQSTFDASLGVPDGGSNGGIGSGVDSLGQPLTGTQSIQAGDYWLVTTAGIIVGISGNDNLSVGDFIWALQDNPTIPSHFAGINMNVNDGVTGGGTVRVAILTAPLVAATPLSFAAAMSALTPAMTTVYNVTVIEDATGREIIVSSDYIAKEVESNTGFASVTVTVLGA